MEVVSCRSRLRAIVVFITLTFYTFAVPEISADEFAAPLAWDRRNQQINVFECTNASDKTIESELEVADYRGAVVERIRLLLGAKKTRHFILSKGQDRYGVARVKTRSSDEHLACVTAIYRLAAPDSGDLVDYAYALPRLQGMSGDVWGMFNVKDTDPTNSGGVKNVISLVNLGAEALSGKIKVFGSDGRVKKELPFSNIAPGNRKNLLLAPSSGDTSGVYRVIPDSESNLFSVFTMRSSKRGEEYVYAYPLLGTYGSCDPAPVYVSTKENAASVVELGNVSDQDKRFSYQLRDLNGKEIRKGTVFLRRKRLKALNLSQYLGAEKSGVFQVSCPARGKEQRSLVLHSLSYGRKANSGPTLGWARGETVSEERAFAGKKTIAPINTFFNASNIHTFLDQSALRSPVKVEILTKDGAKQTPVGINVPANGATGINDLGRVGANFIGQVVLRSDASTAYYSSLTRRVFRNEANQIVSVMDIPQSYLYATSADGSNVSGVMASEINPSSPLVSSLTSLWHMNGNAQDSVGANHGALVGDARCNALGRFNEGCSFDGNGDAVNVRSINAGSSFTLSAWINPAVSRSGRWHNIFSDRFNSPWTSTQFGALYLYNRRIEYWHSSESAARITGGAIPLNQWTLVTLVASPGSVRLYQNGVVQGSWNGSPVFNNSLFIGAKDSGADDRGFKGLIDEVGLWSRALSANEVRELAGGGSNSSSASSLSSASSSSSATVSSASSSSRSSSSTASSASSSSSSAPGICHYTINSGQSINLYSNTANPGQTVCVRAGTYTEMLRPAKSGTAGNVITFKAFPGDECQGAMSRPKVAGSCRVIIDGQNSRATAIDLGNRNYIRVEGFEVRNHRSDGITNSAGWYASTWQTTGNQIVNNYIHDNNENGINSDNSNAALIENNEIFRNGQSAIKNGGQAGCINLIGRGNNIHYNVKDGFDGGLRDNGLVEFNVMYDQFHTDAHQDGIDISNASNLIIRYNTISDFTQLIYLDSDESPAVYNNIEIYGNVLFKNNYPGDSPGIFIALDDSDSANNFKIHSNTCGWLGGTSTNPYKCLEVYGNVRNLTVRNNIAYDSKFAIEPTDSSQFTSNYNLFYASSPDLIPAIQSAMARLEGPQSILANPQFVNYQRRAAWDFRLKSTSPAINKGALGPIAMPNPFVDIAGSVRPQGSALDIGAYEFVSGVQPVNQPPTVNAGPDKTITLPTNSVSLTGTASDDGLPAGSVLTRVWSKVSGPGTVSFSAPTSSTTNATFSVAGSYVLRLTASDSALSASDDVIVTVYPGGNQIPVVSAGPDRAVTLPASASLDGTVTDDGLPNPPAAVSNTWSKVSGPGTVSFANAAAIDTTATFSAAGTYVLRLSASDSSLSASDDVQVVVSAVAALVANAGADVSIITGGSITLSGSASGGSSPYTFRWSPTTGLSNANISNPVASPTATTTYTLTVTDSQARTATDSVQVTVNTAVSCNYIINSGESINKYSNTANPGQTVCVKAGTYNETLRPAKSGTAGNLITFKAYPGDECKGDSSSRAKQVKTDCRVVIDGQNVRGQAVSINPRNYIKIEGFEMKNHVIVGEFRDEGVINIKRWNEPSVQGIEIENNYIHNNVDTAVLGRNGVSNITVKNNQIRNSYNGIQVGGSNIRVAGNTVQRTVCDALKIGNTFITVDNNIIGDADFDGNDPDPVGCHPDAFDIRENASNFTISNNIIYDYTQLIYFAPDVDGSVVQDINIYGNVLYNKNYGARGGETYAIMFDLTLPSASARNLNIHSNTCGWLGDQYPYGCIWIPLVNGNVQNVKIRNNIMHAPGIYVDSSVQGYSSDYNLFYSTTSNTHKSNRPEGANSIGLISPQFVNYTGRNSSVFDFRLKSTSPAINKGGLGTITAPSPFLDIDGISRPQGGAFDIGAYEFVGSIEPPVNQAPGVAAGPDLPITITGSATLNGTVSDDGLPNPPAAVSVTWSKVSGPGTVSFANAATIDTSATFSAAGTYVLRLSASDSSLSASDDVQVVVSTVAALVANAGADVSINSGGSTTLSGSATGGNSPYTFRWSPTTGLSNANISNPVASPAATTTYTLTVTDSQARTATDSVQVTVNTAVSCNYIINSGESINKYSSTATAGQTVCVKAGTYGQSLRPTNSGTAGNLITFKAYPGDECQGALGQPKVANSCKVDLTSTVDLGYLGGHNYIRIEGFEIRNTGGAGVANMESWYGNSYQTKGNQIVNNFIHDTGEDGIDSRNSDGLLAENNEIYDTGTSGVTFGGEMSSRNLVARGNNLHHIGKDGFQGGCDNCMFERNQMYDSVHTDQHQDGFDLGWITNSIIRYNTISDFTQLLYGGSDGPAKNWENLQIYGNVFYNDQYGAGGGESPGIYIDQTVGAGATRNITIHSNTFGWLGGPSYGSIQIYAGGNPVSGIKVYNNIFYANGVKIDGGGSSVTSDYNLYFNTSKPSYEGSHSTVGQNPQFVNYQGQGSANFDFHLKSTSPAINTGGLGSITPPNPFIDIDGNSRPLGGILDIGAYEYRP